MPQTTILMIGNYLSSPRHNRNVWHSLAERLPEVGWKVLTTSSKENQLLRLLDMLTTIFRKRHKYIIAQIDVFSGKAFAFAKFSALLLKWIKKPVILTLHGGGLPDFAQKHAESVRCLLESAAFVVTPSPFLQQGLNQFRPDIRYIPNPVQLSQMPYRHRKSAQPKLIWVRAFHETYNPTMAVRVLDLLKNDYPGLTLQMIGPHKGDGSLHRVRRMSAERQLTEKLHIIPGVDHDQIPALLDQADIFINTSNYDTSPRSLIEAMACGLCVVSTDVGGVPWLVDDGENGLLVPPNDSKGMANAIRSILEEPDLAAQLSRNARQKAEQLDWQTILPQWDALFREVLGR